MLFLLVAQTHPGPLAGAKASPGVACGQRGNLTSSLLGSGAFSLFPEHTHEGGNMFP